MTGKKNTKNKDEVAKKEINEKAMAGLPKEAQEKLKAIQGKLGKLQTKIVAKLTEKYVLGIALAPPSKSEDGKVDVEKINAIVLIDDSDSQNLSKEELKQKLEKVIAKEAKSVDKNINPQTIMISELWQECYDGRHEMLQHIAMSAPVYDKGMLAAVKISEIHKSMVLKKFEKYIVSYVLSGSLVRGEATDQSDIDVMIIIDDTDVKKMTRAELKDKLRAIIIGMGIEAGEMTGIRNKLNIQVYILTEFWDSLKEANPVIFTLLRDGIPFYDRGMFMPWKQMLKMGKIKPSQEAIDLFMSSGDQMLKRVDMKIKEIGMEDTYYAILTPSQAALMLYGVPPPAPKETAKLMRELFVKKEKILEAKFVDILDKNIQIRKELEHGSKEKLTGKELDELVTNAEAFLKRIDKLFNEIQVLREKESILHIYDTILTVLKDSLKVVGVKKVPSKDLEKIFNEKLVRTGQVPDRFKRILKDALRIKKKYDDKKITKNDVESLRKISNELIKGMVEFIQRSRGKQLERAKIRVKHGDLYAEVLLLDKVAFIIHDIDADEKRITKAEITKEGGLVKYDESNLEELEHALAELEMPPKVFIKAPLFKNLEEIFGKKAEVLLNYF